MAIRYYFKSIFWGSLIGLYYGQKKLPFPIQYLPKQDQLGDIKIDLSIVNSVKDDLVKFANNLSKRNN